MNTRVLLALMPLISSCQDLGFWVNDWLTPDAGPEPVICSDEGAGEGEGESSGPQVTISAGNTPTPVTGDLTIRGTVTGVGDETVRRVLVLGVRATNTGFNFDTFSVTLPRSILLFSQQDGVATLTTEVVTLCAPSTIACSPEDPDEEKARLGCLVEVQVEQAEGEGEAGEGEAGSEGEGE